MKDYKCHLLDEEHDRDRAKRERLEECRLDAECAKKRPPVRAKLGFINK